ncbi:hypothetical protein KFK09_026689 [Dendrobium nobile]|uniref:Uncharacterized protein n=1 Tax=Dendrobium nobile TaxID=94219 RepID=A0A8T3A8F9_DENNO|nr:hypothetical protein KFK09_026689 [Dendrobium nobile]
MKGKAHDLLPRPNSLLPSLLRSLCSPPVRSTLFDRIPISIRSQDTRALPADFLPRPLPNISSNPKLRPHLSIPTPSSRTSLASADSSRKHRERERGRDLPEPFSDSFVAVRLGSFERLSLPVRLEVTTFLIGSTNRSSRAVKVTISLCTLLGQIP